LQQQLQQMQLENGTLRGQLDKAEGEVAKTPKGRIKAIKNGFTVPKGEEDYTHVIETKVNGEEVEPRIRPYEAHQYDTLISKQQGYEAEVIHRGE
jgi:hypothetical protein